MSAYTASLTAARLVATDAAKALDTARRNSANTLDADTYARLAEFAGAEKMAQMEAQMAAIGATVPALQEAHAAAASAVTALEADACGRCFGHGVYSGASRYVNARGQKQCFDCKGDGRCSRARRAVASVA